MTGASFMGNNQFMPGGMMPVGDMKVETTSEQAQPVEANTEVADWISRIAIIGIVLSLLAVVVILFVVLPDEYVSFAAVLPMLMTAIMSLVASVGMLGFSWVVRACIVYLHTNGHSKS